MRSNNAGAASSSRSSQHGVEFSLGDGDGRRRRQLFHLSHNVNKRSSFSETAAAATSAAGLPHLSGSLSEEEEEDGDGRSSSSRSTRIDVEDEERRIYEEGACAANYNVNAVNHDDDDDHHWRSQSMRTMAATTPNSRNSSFRRLVDWRDDMATANGKPRQAVSSRRNPRRRRPSTSPTHKPPPPPRHRYHHVTDVDDKRRSPPSISWKWGFTSSRRAVKFVGGALDLLSIYRKDKPRKLKTAAAQVDPPITTTTMERVSGKQVATAKYNRGGRASPVEDIDIDPRPQAGRRWTSEAVAIASGRGRPTDDMDANMNTSTHRDNTIDRLRAAGGGCCRNVDVINEEPQRLQSVNAKSRRSVERHLAIRLARERRKRMVAEEALREVKGDRDGKEMNKREKVEIHQLLGGRTQKKKKKNKWREEEEEEETASTRTDWGAKLERANDKERKLKKRLKEITEEKTEMQKRLALLTEKKDALILEVQALQRRSGNSRYSGKSATAEDVDLQVEYAQAAATSIDRKDVDDRKEGKGSNNVVVVADVRQSEDPHDNGQGSRRDDNESSSIITQVVNDGEVRKDGEKEKMMMMMRSIVHAEEVEIEKMYRKEMRKALEKARAECRDQEMIIESLRMALDLQLQLEEETAVAAAGGGDNYNNKYTTTSSSSGTTTAGTTNAGKVIRLMKREVVRLCGMEQALRKEAEAQREAAMVAQELNVRLVERLKSLYFHVQRWTSSTLLLEEEGENEDADEEEDEEEGGGEKDDKTTVKLELLRTVRTTRRPTPTLTTTPEAAAAAAAAAEKEQEKGKEVLPDLICSLDDQHFRRFLHQCCCPHTRQLKKLRTHTSHLTHHRTMLLQEVADLRVTLSQATQRSQQLEQQLTLKGKELETVHQDLQRTREQRDAIKNNADFMTQEAIRLVTEVGKLSRRVEELDTNVMLKDGQISILHGALQDFNKTPTIT